MKKTKLLKKTAFPAVPQLADGFVPPAGFDFKMSVSIREKDIKIYGYTGTQWEMIHNTDGAIDEFIGDVLHQKYYFESKTGVEQPVRVSFLSQEEEQGLGLTFGTSPGSRKLHHMHDVPIYHGGDGDRFLTVRSDGSLAWLLANESFVVETEGGESQSPSASPGAIVGLEEDSNLTLHGNAQLVDGVLHVDGTSGTYASLPHSLDYERESGDLTVSMWIKPNSLPDNWNAGLVTKMGAGWSGWITAISTMDADGPDGNMTQGGLQTSFFGGGNANNRYHPANGIALNEWQHVAFVMVAVGEYKMYHNGVEILSYNPTNRPQSTTGDLRFGGWGPTNGYEGFFDGQIDGIKIEKVAKTAEEILGEYNGNSSSETPQATFLEELASFNASHYGSMADGVYVNNHSGGGSFGTINLADENLISFTNGEPTHEEFTVSFWTYLNDGQDAGNVNLAGGGWGTVDGQLRRLMFGIGGANGGSQHFRVYLNNTFATTYMNVDPYMRGAWTHVALVCKSDGSELVVRTYLNGNKLTGAIGSSNRKPLGTKLLPPESHTTWGLGGNGLSGKTIKGKIDSMQIEEGITLTDAQVAAIAAQTDRQMGIAEAAALPAEGDSQTPNVSGGLEVLETNTLAGNAQVTAHEGLLTSNTGDYAVATSNYHNGATEQTISAWVKPSEITTDWSTVVLTRNWNGLSNGFAMHIKSNQIRITGPQQSNPLLDRNYTFQSDTWYKLNLVWTATSVKVFVNGVQVGSTNASGQIRGGVSNLHFGSGTGGAHSYKGNILGVTVENVAKTDSEILSSYQSEAP